MFPEWRIMYKAFLIKYGEIGVKGKNRYLFEDALVRQIRYALKKTDGEFEVTKENGRIYATAVSDFDFDEAVEALKTVFGIIGICPVVQIEDNGFDDLADTVIKYFDSAYPDKHFSFKVNARRARKNYPMDSMEINMEMGGRLLDAFPELSVDVHNQDVLLQIEIRNKINIYSTEIPGPGGMPVGTAGKQCYCFRAVSTARLPDTWLQSAVSNWKQRIFMHRHIRASGQSRRLLTLQSWLQNIPVRLH